MEEIKLNQTTADKILAEINDKAYQVNHLFGNDFVISLADVTNIINSLVSEPVEDEQDVVNELKPHILDIKQMVIQLQQFQDSRYFALLTAIAVKRDEK